MAYADRFRKILQSKKAELEQLIHTAQDNKAAVELDQTKVGRLSRMDALQAQAMSKEVERRRRLELQRIEAALQRLEDGEFGYCITCGEEIDKDRLSLDPSTPQCRNCAG
ncbi:TraR/DksA family transcriptional regulator [Luteithermobacter gelatinilyticus]|uniref:TraR/DksA family transcriptional regulator n=1 Tax=Luteithermobacter gelatinilyticus TaxID=2582913 RepID=UPI0011070298|nr:TraR/DksA C4-type zinc finger protein [Luteithermobacter gelatinilyticus]|tara:strand:- start:13339 stop:13668 length:330 start_codon:yes stop_codon:yes gene_type:complete